MVSATVAANRQKDNVSEKPGSEAKSAEKCESKEGISQGSLWKLVNHSTYNELFLYSIGATLAILCGVLQGYSFQLQGIMYNYMFNPSGDMFIKGSIRLVYAITLNGIVVFFATFAKQNLFRRVACSVGGRLRERFLRSLISKSQIYLDGTNTAQLVETATVDIRVVEICIKENISWIIMSTSQLIFAVVFSFHLEPELSTFMCLVFPLVYGTVTLMIRVLGRLAKSEGESNAQASRVAQEAVLNWKTVQSLTAERSFVKKFRSLLLDSYPISFRRALFNGCFSGTLASLIVIFMGGGMLVGGYLFRKGMIREAGNVTTVTLLMLIGLDFFTHITENVAQFQKTKTVLKRLNDVIEENPAIRSNRSRRLASLRGHVRLDGLSFSYPGRKNVIEEVDIEARPGETVALVGSSGCGKSTTFKLLLGQYEPTGGKILIDDINFASLDIQDYLSKIGIVQQQPVLFTGSIEDNIRLGRKATRREVEEAARVAHAHEFIMKLPKGYSTELGSSACSLSGGQKQRLAIARAILSDPPLLLLDEATSALDSLSETVVQEALESASEGRTTLVIAHRLSTIRNADRIVVMEDGRVVEQGTHQELLKLGGAYHRMVAAQSVSTEERTPRLKRRALDRASQYTAFDGSSSMVSDSGTESDAQAAIDGAVQNPSGIKLTREASGVPALKLKKQPKSSGLWLAIRNAGSKRKFILLFYVLSFLRGIEYVINSVFFGMMFEAMKMSKEGADDDVVASIMRTALCFNASQYIGTLLIQIVMGYLMGAHCEKALIELRSRGLARLLSQDSSFFSRPETTPENALSTITAMPTAMRSLFDYNMSTALYAVGGSCFCMLLSFTCWEMGALGIIVVAIMGYFQSQLAASISTMNKKMKEEDITDTLIIEMLTNISTVKALACEKYLLGKVVAAQEKAIEGSTSKGHYEDLSLAIARSFNNFSSAMIGSLRTFIIAAQIYPIATIFRASPAIFLTLSCLMKASNFFPMLVRAHGAASQLFDVTDRQPTIRGGHRKETISGSIRLRNVRFRYSTDSGAASLLTNVNITAKKGQHIALVGPSGCGKSTIIGLLQRIYDPLAGSIRVDGIDMRSMDLSRLRSQMALVGQEPVLFTGTVRDNLLMGCEEGTRDPDLVEVLKQANAQFAFDLPKGLDTEVGEMGSQLSGGQRQRLAIARALARKPVILLLDEATSALDGKSEKAVQSALDGVSAGRTTVTVAHRLSTLRHADLICYVDQGKVLESGTHNELVNCRGLYYNLVQKQTQ